MDKCPSSKKIQDRLLVQENAMRLFRVSRILNIFAGGELGVTLIETLVALAILGVIGAAFLGGLTTASRATTITDERATAESLVRSEMEYVESYAYQYDATAYPVNPGLTIPEGWNLLQPSVEPVHATDDGLQKVTVTAERNGVTVLSVEMYKVDR